MTTNMGSLRYVGRSMSLEAESVLKNRPHRSINHDHLKATLDILKSMRYHRTEKKPWLDEEGNVIWSLGRLRVATFVLSQTFEMVMGLIILLNMVCIIIEANTDAECYPDYADDYSACPKRSGNIAWLGIMNIVLLTIYLLEMGARIFVERLGFFCNKWNLVDASTVLLGWTSVVLAATAGSVINLGLFRLLRMIRVLRAVRLLIAVPEFYLLVTGIYSAMKAIVFGSAMLLLVILFWAVVAVEMFHPLLAGVPPSECERCGDSFKSVWDAAITLFQQIVAGDAWGEVSWPLLELRPWTSIALFLIVVTISLGVLNLILAVIVESAAEARENDSDQKIKNKESERGKSMVELAVLCADLDKDASGTVSLDELFFGYDNLPQFKRLMEQMDIKRDEMELVFNVLNINGSGHIPYLEFCKSLGSFFKRDPIIMHSLVQCSIMDLKKLVQQEVVTSMKQQHEEILYEHRRILTMLHPHGSSTSCRNGTERPMCSSGHCENKVFAGSTVPPLPAQIPKISEPDLRSSEICEMLEQIDKEMNPLLAKVESLVAVLHVASPASTGIRGTSYFGESDKLALDAAVAHESLGERTLHLKGGYLDVQNAKLSDKLQRRLDDAELLKNRLANSIQLSLHIESGQVGLREVLSQPGSCKQPGSLDKENFALTP